MYIIQFRRFHKLVFMAWSLRGIKIKKKKKSSISFVPSIRNCLFLFGSPNSIYDLSHVNQRKRMAGIMLTRKTGDVVFFWRLKCYLTLGRHMEKVDLRDSQAIKKQKRPLLSLAFLVYNPQSKCLTDKETDYVFLPGWPSISHVQCINLAKRRH